MTDENTTELNNCKRVKLKKQNPELRQKDNNKLSCEKCSDLLIDLQKIKKEFQQCRNSLDELEKRLKNYASTYLKQKTTISDEDYNAKDNYVKNDKMGIKTSSSEACTLAQIETELKQFYDFCKENNLSDQEIASICKPLLRPVNSFNSKYLKYVSIVVLIIAILYLLSYFDSVQWHSSAIGRIFLIELLPFWNWQQWKDERCLIKPIGGDEQKEATPQDCSFCEYIEKIDVIDAKQTEIIYEKYIKLHKPLILENGLKNWKEDSELDVIDSILDDDILSKSKPCKFKSNIYFGDGNLYQSLKNVKDSDVYFAHFQNCEFEAVKAFRRYFPRPKFLAPEIRPVQYSWLLISKNYNVEKYKHVLLSDLITIVGQVSGKTDVMLHPNECTEDCESLKIELAAGEVLISTGLWNMDYKPDPKGENLAVILETH